MPGATLQHNISENADPTANFDQPLVSVIITNYNYARYIRPCVESVFSQTYRNIECILVDDASTDKSASVIDVIAEENPNVIVYKRPVNGGQSAAIFDGLSKASGQFVVFLDSDDLLLPNAIASHIYVHSSLRLPVGFTCADMLQIGDNVFMSSASVALNQYILSRGKLAKVEPRQSLSEIVRRPNEVHRDILNNIYLVSNNYKAWVWSATSAMMFRRDALRLWESTPGLSNLRYSTDAFFCYGVNAICGSAVLDIPLAAYRIHGKNGFAARLPLNNVRSYEVGSQGERSMDALKLLLHQARTHRSYYRGLFWRGNQYRAMVSYLKGCLFNLQLNNLRDQSVSAWIGNPVLSRLSRLFLRSP